MSCRVVKMLFLVATIAIAFTSSAVMAAEDQGEGWRVLFDGKTLEGWEKHGGRAEYWVEDGAVVGKSVPNTSNTFLCTKERFKDFELEFEVKVDDALNSGVQIRSNIKENDRVYGPQVEIAARGPSGYIYGEATGEGWLSQNRSKVNVFKSGEWNHFRVVAKGPNIKVWINGEAIEDYSGETVDHDGIIGLQVHGVGGREEPLFVRWRNIRLRELK